MSVGGRPSAPLGRGSVADHCSTGMSIGIACPSRGSARSVLSLYRAECLHQNPLSQIPGQPGPSMQAVLRVRGWMPQRRARNPKGNTIVQPRLKLRASKGIALSALASSWKRHSLRWMIHPNETTWAINGVTVEVDLIAGIPGLVLYY